MRWLLKNLIYLSLAVSPAWAVTNPQSGSTAVTATVPAEPDTPVLIAPANNTVVSSTAPSFIFNPAGGEATINHYQLRLNGQKNLSPIPQSLNTIVVQAQTALTEGTYTWSILAVANNGRTRNSTTWTFTIDTTAPPLLIETAAGQEFSRGPVFTTADRYPEISGQTEAGATVTISFGEQTVSADAGLDRTFNLKPKTALPLGRHAVYASAVDPAGNTTSLPAFYLDIVTAPGGFITIPLPSPLPDLSFTVPVIVPLSLPETITVFPLFPSPACPINWPAWIIIILLILYILYLKYKIRHQKRSEKIA